ncbi:GGDEF domain-containing protein [Thiobacter aerophilum]|uniref:diguanylate cyclase n=1 Tax=Thiobacter aerophilum TaxID=3121275 RepID=A0ABV0EF29_9BURK
MKRARELVFGLTRLKKPVAVALGLLLFALIAVLDVVAPPALNAHALFLLPIVLVAWNAGAAWAAGFAVAAGMVAVLSGLAFGQPYAGVSLLMLSALLRTAVYLLVALAIAKLMRRLYDQECALSRTDFLTGLPNRYAFYDVVGWELERQRRYGGSLAVIYLDCDNFKQINDRLGHSAGDALLKTVAQEIGRNVRSTDLPARLGGDEYAVLLPQTGGEAALGVAQALHKALDAAMRAHGWDVTFSIGVAACDTPARDVDALIELADRLMYQAKQGGKDRIAYAAHRELA